MKAVLFDMDGVLVNSEPVIIEASLRTLRKYGVEAKETDFKEFTGMGDDLFIGGVARKYGVEYDPKMKAEAYEVYFEIIDELIGKFPGVLPLISLLKEKGYTLAVASASDLVKVKANLKALGASEDDFAAIITGSDVERKKPFPDIYLKAAAAIGAEPSECIVIEDAISGTQAGVAAGMKVACVTTSFPAEPLWNAGASWVFDDIYSVSEIVS
ncbi:MAG: HAD-IA family hydrolase [Clostridia bacterium]|nr:HAD-IA family hydrolase [Clostridia bacterium]